jgi:hypothetical protein
LYDQNVMKINFLDPGISVSLGIILIGIGWLVWAVRQLIRKSPESGDDLFAGGALPSEGMTDNLFSAKPSEAKPFEDKPTEPLAAFQEVQFTKASAAPVDAAIPIPAGVSQEMVDRLDNMAHRLNDMQTVLQKQVGPSAPGTPLSPETIDKLLKIISNVTQQVDILQRSIGTGPAPGPANPMNAPAPAPKPAATPTQFAAPSPASSGKPSTTPSTAPSGGLKPPVAAPSAGSPGLKPFGVTGGVLSRSSPAPDKPTPARPPGANPDSGGTVIPLNPPSPEK